VGVSTEKLQQLKDATDVLESVVSKQREEIAHAQAGYDALYERFSALSSKMYDALQVETISFLFCLFFLPKHRS